jgi:hypothetical protein
MQQRFIQIYFLKRLSNKPFAPAQVILALKSAYPYSCTKE